MASLRKRPKSDYWVCCYTTADGHRTQRSTGTTDKEEAMAVCRLWENEAVAEKAAMEKATTVTPAKDRRFIWAAAAVAVLLQIFAIYWLMKPSGPEPVSLFVELDKSEQVPATFLEQQYALRHRWVRINEEAFEAFDENAPEFMLNLFDDETHRVDVAAYRKHYTGAKSVVGLVENDLHSSVVISRRKSMKGIIAGSIGLPDGRRFLVTHGGEGKHVIIEIDMAKAPKHSAQPSELQRLRATPSKPAEGVGANDHLYDASEKPKTQMAKLDGKTGASQFVRGLPLDSLMAAAGINQSNTTNVYGFYGRGGAALTQGPTTPSRILYQRTGTTEFIDVMFVYESALLASFTDEADLQLKIDNLIEDTNLVFKKCLIPLEVRQAILDPTNVDPVTQEPVVPNNTIFLAKARAWSGGATANIDGLPGQTIGGSGPAWEEITAPVKPVWGSTSTPASWTTQPTMGVYAPLYETPAFAGDNESALDWISDARNSLVYGDQYWPEPYINFPESYRWMLLPVCLDANATKNTPPEARADFSQMDYTTAENPDIAYGPIDSGVYQPFSTDVTATGAITSPYGITGLNAVTAGTLETTGELRNYVDRDDAGSLIGSEFFMIYPLNRLQAKPNYYIRNDEDGNASYAPVTGTVQGTIDPSVDTFTAITGTLGDQNNTALQQDALLSLVKPLALKWVDFNNPQMVVRDIGSSKYTLHFTATGANASDPAVIDALDLNSTYDVLTKEAHGFTDGDKFESNSSNITVNTPYYAELIDVNSTYLRTTSGYSPSAWSTNSLMTVDNRLSGNRGNLGIDTFSFVLPHGLQTGNQVFIQEGDAGAFPIRTINTTAAALSPDITRNVHYDVYRWNPNVVSLHRIKDRTQTPEKVYYNFDGLNSLVLDKSKTGDLVREVGGGIAGADLAAGTAPTGNLQALYTFGGNADDTSGNARNGTVDGAALTKDRFLVDSNAYLFDGDDNITAVTNFGDSNSITLAAWVKIDQMPANSEVLIHEGDDSAQNDMQVRLMSTSTINFLTKDEDELTASSTSLVGGWHHVVCVADAINNTKEIWIDGVQVANNASWTGTANVGDHSNLFLGMDEDGARRFNGALDEVRVYDAALNDQQVWDLYRTEAAASSQGSTKQLNDIISVAARYSPNNRPAVPDRMWLADLNGSGVYQIRQLSDDGTLAVVAGGGATNPDNNGTATAAQFTDIDDIAVDGGSAVADSRIYVAAGTMGRVYRVTLGGNVELLAGSGTATIDSNASANGAAQTHALGTVVSVAVDKAATTYYIAEQDTGTGMFAIHRVTTASNAIVRVAGGGANDPDLNATSAVACQLTNIDDIAVDDTGQLYFADNVRGAVWRLDAGGSLTKMAGSTTTTTEVADGALPTSGRVAAATIATDANFIYLGGQRGGGAHRVRKFPVNGGAITTVAGGGTKDVLTVDEDTVFAVEGNLPNVTDVCVDSDGNVFFGDDNSTQSFVWEVNATPGTASPWADGQIVYIVDTNSTRPSAWPGLPPYDSAVLTGMSDSAGNALNYFGPFWVNVDGNTTTNPNTNKFVLSSAPFDNSVAAGINGAWTNLGTSNTQPFADQNITFASSGTLYLVTGNSVDVSRFWVEDTCDLVQTKRYDLLVDDTNGTIRTSTQVDFTYSSGSVELSGAQSLEVQPGDYDPEYSGVIGDRNGSVGTLRMSLNDGARQSGVRHFGTTANPQNRYNVLHDSNGTFRFSTANYRVPTNTRDPRADVICILVAGPGSGVGYYYGKTARGDNAIPDMVESATTIEDVKRLDHPNVITNRDTICFIACQWDGTMPYYTFAHELGHNLGAHHGVGDFDQVALNPLDYKTTGMSALQPNITFSPYRNDRISTPTDNGAVVRDTYIALGTYFTGEPITNPGAQKGLASGRFCTIMAYGGPRNNIGVYTRVGVFSSPFVYFQGTKTGEQFGWKLPPPISRYERPLEFNNAKAISTVGPIAAYYRDGNGSDRTAPEEVVIATPPRGVVTASPSMAQNRQPRPQRSDGTVTYAPGVGPGVAPMPGPRGSLQMAAAVGGNGRQLGGGVNTQPTRPPNKGGTGLGAGTSGPGNTKKGGGGLGGTINPAPPPVKTVPGPPNDNWAKPMLFPARPFAALDATNRGATPEIGVELDQRGAVLLPQVGRPNCRSVWFRWDLPKQLPWTRVTFSTKGSQFDTTMKAFIGGVQPSLGTGIAHNDNVRQGAWSEIVIQRAQLMRNGQLPASVLICVDGVGGAQGQIRISARAE